MIAHDQGVVGPEILDDAFTLVEVDGAFMYTKGSASADDGASRGAQR
jgi:hypothetical protein